MNTVVHSPPLPVSLYSHPPLPRDPPSPLETLWVCNHYPSQGLLGWSGGHRGHSPNNTHNVTAQALTWISVITAQQVGGAGGLLVGWGWGLLAEGQGAGSGIQLHLESSQQQRSCCWVRSAGFGGPGHLGSIRDSTLGGGTGGSELCGDLLIFGGGAGLDDGGSM